MSEFTPPRPLGYEEDGFAPPPVPTEPVAAENPLQQSPPSGFTEPGAVNPNMPPQEVNVHEPWTGDFNTFFNEFYGLVLSKINHTAAGITARGYGHDIAQEVMHRAWKAGWHEAGHTKAHIAGLLGKTAYRASIDRWRSISKSPELPTDFAETQLDLPPVTTGGFGIVELISDLENLSHSKHLSPTEVEAIGMVLLAARRYTAEEIGTMYNIKPGTVKSRLHNLRKVLGMHLSR